MQDSIMSCYSREKIQRCDYDNVCKNHSARSDKELYRVCPSKLSKRELEDLYFSLLENNLELKRTINGQQDKIRCLSTRVQRLTAVQKKAKEFKDCCVGTKSIINDQKESITQLKLVNQRLAEKVQMLNMRLCSAKQFYKRPSGFGTSRCLRCSTNNNSTSKRDSVSAKSAQTEPQEIEKQDSGESCDEAKCVKQNDVETTAPCEGNCDETNCPGLRAAKISCEENKCRTVMEELKNRIVTLQLELSSAHSEYMSRISRLEDEVRVVRRDNVKVRADKHASHHDLVQANTKATDLLTGMRAAEAKCVDLKTELLIQKRKVAELETRLKAATMSEKVNKALEEHLIAAQESISKELMSARPKAKPTTDPDYKPMKMSYSKPSKMSDSKPIANRKESEETKPAVPSDSKPIANRKDFEETKPAVPSDSKLIANRKESEETKPAVPSDSKPIASRKESEETKPAVPSDSKPIANRKESEDSISAVPSDSIPTEIPDNCECPQPGQDKKTKESSKMKAQAAQNAAEMRESMEIPKLSKPLDDSGFSEPNKSQDDEGIQRMNQELISRLNELQNQVKNMKSSASEGEKRHERQKSYDSTYPPPRERDRLSTDARMYKSREPQKVEDQRPSRATTAMMEDYDSKTTASFPPAAANRKSGSSRSLPSKTELVFGKPDSVSQEMPNKTNLESNRERNQVERRSEERGSKNTETGREDSRTEMSSIQSAPPAQTYPRSSFASKCWDEDDAELPTNALCKACQICTIKNKCDLQTCVNDKHTKCEGPRQLAVRIVKNDDHNKYQIPGPIPTNGGTNTSTPRNHRFSNLDSPHPLEMAERDVTPPIIKTDKHNSFQIPGPIASPEAKVSKRSSFRRTSLDRASKKRDSSNHDKEKNSNHDKEKKQTPLVTETMQENLREQKRSTFTPDLGPEAQLFKDYAAIDDEGVAKRMEERNFRESRDSLETTRDRLIQTKNNELHQKDSQDTTMQIFYPQSEQASDNIKIDEPETRMDKTEAGTQHEPLVQQSATETQVQTREEKVKKQRVSMIEQATYTVMAQHTRSTSPDNTEVEISSMTDLPSERSPKVSSPGERTVSPGEDKITSTITDTYTFPTTNYTLSEGEMPNTPSPPSLPNDGQQLPNTYSRCSGPADHSGKHKVEAALLAITEELARCKNLLLTQRPETSRQSIQSQTIDDTNLSNQTIELRHGVAKQNISDTYQPKCMFTLHIGTVVLSDEAVLMSQNKNLVLTWKFYDQNVAMSRMRTGRVVLFDYSTEYDIKITDDFLDYMKHKEMLIVICELDKQDEPFASCKLPLRDALLHTNRRADISLALMAGPQMISARAMNDEAADALDARDEVGVIDLWCMLRCDTKHLPTINSAIARHSLTTASPNIRHSRHIMPQVVDDDPSNDITDMDLLQQTKMAPLSEAEAEMNIYKDVGYARSSVRSWGNSMYKFPTTVDIDGIPPEENKGQPAYDPNKYPSNARSSCAPHLSHNIATTSSAPDPEPETQTEASADFTTESITRRESSEIILNEVAAKIKTPSDMKQVIHKSSLQNDFARLKSDGEPSQAPGSGSSLRSIVARLQKRPRHSSKNQQSESRRSTLTGPPDKERRPTMEMSNRPLTIGESNDMEIYRKYDNISKWLGRSDNPKKNVTYGPKYLDSNNLRDEEPQRDVEEDEEEGLNRLEITVLWLALNEECEAMTNPHVQRVYVAYSFLGRTGAEFETPVSLPKPKHYVDKCYFNFKKTFILQDSDLPLLGHMARCRASSKVSFDHKETDCIVFAVVSEPPEDPLGLESCEDIGYAYLYLGDLLAYSAGSYAYTEVVPVQTARGGDAVCGVLAVRLDGLDVVRRCLHLAKHDPNDVPQL